MVIRGSRIFALTLLGPLCTAADEVYRWVDEKGTTVFSDQKASPGQAHEVVPLLPPLDEDRQRHAEQRSEKIRAAAEEFNRARQERAQRRAAEQASDAEPAVVPGNAKGGGAQNPDTLAPYRRLDQISVADLPDR